VPRGPTGPRCRAAGPGSPPWAIVGVFLGAYGIPATFHNIATVTASNSISNSVSATPGDVGVTQALNTTALKARRTPHRDRLTRSAGSYADAKVRSREMKEKRRRKSPA